MMRSAWRFLVLRRLATSFNQTSSVKYLDYQVRKLDIGGVRGFSSFLLSNRENIFTVDKDTNISQSSKFSTECDVENNELDISVLKEVFSETRNDNDIEKDVKSRNLLFSYENILQALRNFDDHPDVAFRFFSWILATDSKKLSSKSYNLMLRILGRKEHLKRFWDLIEVMKTKGYGISKNTYIKVLDKFVEDGMVGDYDSLKELCRPKSAVDSIERICSSLCKIIRDGDWNDEMRNKLNELHVDLSVDIVELVLENLSDCPMKALLFFRWVEENPSFKHSSKTYNIMIGMLSREDCIDNFWIIIQQMKDAGYCIEKETYFMILRRFCKRRMMNEAVSLYEFMMSGEEKLHAQDCIFFLRKISASENPDLELFSRVIRSFTGQGNVITDSMFKWVLRSMMGAGNLEKSDKILTAMEQLGFVENSFARSQVVLGLCKAKMFDQAFQYIDELEISGKSVDLRTWGSLVEGHCIGGQLEKASCFFREMVKRKGPANNGSVLELLVKEFSSQSREKDACKLLDELVKKNQVKPFQSTYMFLLKKLLRKRNFIEALSLLGLMKCNGFPPPLNTFIKYISMFGMGDDAVEFTKAVSVNRFPSTKVFLHIIEAFFKVRRFSAAHDFLSKSPSYIRNHPDILDLFCSQKSEEAPAVNV